jgi:hypothetical protein
VLATKVCAAQYYCSALHNCFAKCDANVQTPARLQLRLRQAAIFLLALLATTDEVD